MKKIKQCLEDEIKIAEVNLTFATKDSNRIKEAILEKVKSGNFDSTTLDAYSKNLKYQEDKIQESAQKINAYTYFLNVAKAEEKDLL